MGKTFLTFLFSAIFIFGTGASIIDRETKESIVGLNAKFGRLADEGRAHHVEQMKFLKAQQEMIQRLERRIDWVEHKLKAPTPTAAPLSAPVPPQQTSQGGVPSSQAETQATSPTSEAPQSVKTDEASPGAIPVAQVLTTPSRELPDSVPPQPLPQIESSGAVETPSLSVGLTAVPTAINNLQSLTILSLLISGITGVFLIVLFIQMKLGDDRKRQTSWKSEIDSLRDEMIRGRPHLKILSEGEKIEVLNAGETMAEEVKISVGPAASSMKQKLKIVHRMPAGEKTKIEIPGQLSEDPLYATLEYRNPSTGRTYKEQYILKMDQSTGHLSPLTQGL